MADKEQEDIISSSIGRFMKMGGMVGAVGASLLGNKTMGVFRGSEKKDEKRGENLIANAMRVVSTLGEMKGGVMKIGQMLSLHEGMLPKEFTQILSMLQKEAPPVSFSALEKVLKSNLPNHEQLFKSIEREPFAAASIGQVHRAVLADGTEVALKIQYPNMDQVIRSDLKNLRTLFGVLGSMMLKMDMDKIWGEVETQLSREVDYIQEAREQETFRELLADLDYLQIPRVIKEASGKQVLCTEFMPGEDIAAVKSNKYTQDNRDEWGANLYHLTNMQLFQHERIQSDPNIANYAFLPGGKIIMYDFGSVKYLPPNLVDGYRRIIHAFLDDRFGEITGILKDMGIHYHDGRVLEDHIIEKFTDLFAPVFNSNDYRFSAADNLVARLVETSRNFIFEGLGMVFPPDIIFVDRATGGLFGNLTALGAQARWRDTLLEIVEKPAAKA